MVGIKETGPKILQLSFTEIKYKGCIARSSMLYMSVALLTWRVMRFERIWPPPMRVITWFFVEITELSVIKGRVDKKSFKGMIRRKATLLFTSEDKLDLMSRVKISRALYSSWTEPWNRD